MQLLKDVPTLQLSVEIPVDAVTIVTVTFLSIISEMGQNMPIVVPVPSVVIGLMKEIPKTGTLEKARRFFVVTR
jgi:hypothetical protein